MELRFEKMHGLGNDFAVFEDWDARIDLSPSQVAFLCNRRFGIGADGLIFIQRSSVEGCRAFMHYINADGTLAQMCGNGIRCMTKYLVDHGFIDENEAFANIETRAGVRQVGISRDAQGRFVSAAVDMGAPVLEPTLIPSKCAANAVAPDGTPYVRETSIGTPWGEFAFTLVSMGNPHAVCFITDWARVPDQAFGDERRKCLETLDVGKLGPYLEHSPLFPEKANIEFVEPVGLGLAMRVWERGCGETLACGTGACAVAVAAALTDRIKRETDVMLPGGTLHITLGDDGHVTMTGPADRVFSGSIEMRI